MKYELRLNVKHSPDGSGDHWSAPSMNAGAVLGIYGDKPEAEGMANYYRRRNAECTCGCVVVVQEDPRS